MGRERGQVLPFDVASFAFIRDEKKRMLFLFLPFSLSERRDTFHILMAATTDNMAQKTHVQTLTASLPSRMLLAYEIPGEKEGLLKEIV